MIISQIFVFLDSWSLFICTPHTRIVCRPSGSSRPFHERFGFLRGFQPSYATFHVCDEAIRESTGGGRQRKRVVLSSRRFAEKNRKAAINRCNQEDRTKRSNDAFCNFTYEYTLHRYRAKSGISVSQQQQQKHGILRPIPTSSYLPQRRRGGL